MVEEPTMNEIKQTKICSKCQSSKDLIMFYEDRTKKDGRNCWCKECIKLYNNNRKDETKTYYQLNRTYILDRASKYREQNKENILEYQRSYYTLNSISLLERHKVYQKTTNGKAVNKNKKHKRRAVTNSGDVTTQQLAELEQNAKTCYWCECSLKKVKVHIDHYVPLSKGGKHTLSNLVVSCQRCNNQKHAKDPLEFANSIGKLL